MQSQVYRARRSSAMLGLGDHISSTKTTANREHKRFIEVRHVYGIMRRFVFYLYWPHWMFPRKHRAEQPEWYRELLA